MYSYKHTINPKNNRIAINIVIPLLVGFSVSYFNPQKLIFTFSSFFMLLLFIRYKNTAVDFLEYDYVLSIFIILCKHRIRFLFLKGQVQFTPIKGLFYIAFWQISSLSKSLQKVLLSLYCSLSVSSCNPYVPRLLFISVVFCSSEIIGHFVHTFLSCCFSACFLLAPIIPCELH